MLIIQVTGVLNHGLTKFEQHNKYGWNVGALHSLVEDLITAQVYVVSFVYLMNCA